MKISDITAVTAENFAEVEKAVYQYECRRKKDRAVWAFAGTVGGLAFFFLVPAALYVMDLLLPSNVFFALIGSIAAAALSAFVLHAAAAAIRRPTLPPDAPFVPLEGSELEKAQALHERSEAIGSSLPLSWTALGSIVYLVVGVMVGIQETLDDGLLLTVLAAVFVGGIFLLVYVLPYTLYFELCTRLYPTYSGVPKLKQALSKYVFFCRLDEEMRQENEKAKQDRLRGDALYRRAIAGGRVDEDLIAEAADLGSRPACLYMGRLLTEAWYSGVYIVSYTKEEMKEMAEAAKQYYYIASQEEDFPQSRSEAELGYLIFCEMTGKLTMGMYDWKRTLEQLREFKASGKVPKSYDDLYDFAVETAVEWIDRLTERDRWLNTPTSGTDSGSSSASWNTVHDDLDAVQDALGGPGWSDGV